MILLSVEIMIIIVSAFLILVALLLSRLLALDDSVINFLYSIKYYNYFSLKLHQQSIKYCSLVQYGWLYW